MPIDPDDVYTDDYEKESEFMMDWPTVIQAAEDDLRDNAFKIIWSECKQARQDWQSDRDYYRSKGEEFKIRKPPMPKKFIEVITARVAPSGRGSSSIIRVSAIAKNNKKYVYTLQTSEDYGSREEPPDADADFSWKEEKE